MSRFKDSAFGPTVILAVICLTITLALAVVYNLTAPVIAVGELEAANEARMQVLPEADSFTQAQAELPEGVTEAFKADNGAGYVFTSQYKGFGGDVVYMIGMDAQGAIVGIQMFSHEETPGLGSKIGEAEYLAKYYGNADPMSVDAVTGATITSNSLKHSLIQAIAAYEIVKGA